MKRKIGFVGLGAGGSNVVDEFYELGYDALCINTASVDLETLSCKLQHHIAGANGCNKNRKKALDIAMDKYQEVAKTIHDTFPKKKVINIVFSMAGGTGSGFAPLILDYLTQVYPNQVFNAVMILPSKSESIKGQINTVECYEQIKQVEGIRSFYVLDNNNCNEDRFKINKMFASLYNQLVNITTSDKRGVIDGAEVETILTSKGSTYIANISDNNNFNYMANNSHPNFSPSSDIGWKLKAQLNINPFTIFDKGCQYISLSLAHDRVSYDSIESMVGLPLDRFVGYNNCGSHLIAITGMPFPKKRIAEIIQNVNNQQNKLFTNSEPEMPELKLSPLFTNNNQEQTEKKKIDIDELFNKFR